MRRFKYVHKAEETIGVEELDNYQIILLFGLYQILNLLSLHQRFASLIPNVHCKHKVELRSQILDVLEGHNVHKDRYLADQTDVGVVGYRGLLGEEAEDGKGVTSGSELQNEGLEHVNMSLPGVGEDRQNIGGSGGTNETEQQQNTNHF